MTQVTSGAAKKEAAQAASNVVSLPGLPVICTTAKRQQLLTLAQRGAEIADMHRITSLPEELIQHTLEQTQLPPELAELTPECQSYEDLRVALQAAKLKRQLSHEDRASSIYSLILQRTEEMLHQGSAVQLRTLLEGIRILSTTTLATNGKTPVGRPTSSATAAAVAAGGSTVVNISFGAGMVNAARPVLDGNSNVIATKTEDGTTQQLVGIKTQQLRDMAGTSATAAAATRGQSLRSLLTAAASVNDTSNLDSEALEPLELPPGVEE